MLSTNQTTVFTDPSQTGLLGEGSLQQRSRVDANSLCRHRPPPLFKFFRKGRQGISQLQVIVLALGIFAQVVAL